MDERRAGGLWCHEVLVHLDAFVDGELDPATLAAAKAHVAECTACAAFGGAYAALVRGLRETPSTELPPQTFDRLRARLAQLS